MACLREVLKAILSLKCEFNCSAPEFLNQEAFQSQSTGAHLRSRC